MSLQRINWTQVDTENVPSGSTINLGSPSGSLNAVYADNLYISGTSVTALIAAGGGTGGTGGTNGSSGTSGINGTSGSSGTSGAGTAITLTDGTSTINNVDKITFSGATITDSGNGDVIVTIIGGTGGTGGTNGSSGTSGSNGTDGSSGTSGINGTNGSSGTSGINGTNGSSGTSGSNGTDGTSGTSGDGTSGTSGTSGDGTSGTSGTSGVGTSGTSGTSGYAGYEGHLAIWRYSGNTNTSVDPGNGYFNLNSPSWGISTTSITLDNFAYSPNQDFESYLDGLTIGTILKLVKVGDTSTFKLLKIDLVSPFDIGYEKYTVSELSGDGTTPNDNDEFLIIPLGVPGLTGTAGTSGSSGTAGTSGTSGSSGSSGSSGTAGTSGTSGSDGTSGTSGSSGTAGTSGTSGSSGSSGTSGTSGSSGISGVDGTNGSSGTAGTSGSDGTSGDSIFALTGSNWYTNENVIIDGKLTVNELIVSSSITNMTVQYSSGSTKFGDTSDDTHTFTGSVNISGSIVATGTSLVSGSSQVILSGVTGFSDFSSSISTSLAGLTTTLNDSNIWQQTGSYYSANQNIQITGSVGSLMKSPDGATDEKYALAISQSIHANNINVGVPTSNDWGSNLNGSYFNNFNKNTDVSEILRFVAGLLSSSAPDAAPNTKTYSTATKNTVNSTVGSVSTTVPGSVPQSSTNTTITYLNGKGFANTGQPLFSGITVNTNASYGHTFTSVSAGSTNVSSSVDAQLFGLGQLSSGTPTNLRVSGSFIFKFKDNSLKTDTATSSSNHLITQTGAGTTSGVTLAKITTANPAVIPAAYQDGKFVSVFSPTIYNGGLSGISGSGYYNITSSISISSGSATTYTTPVTSDTEVFYAPLSTIATNIPAQTPTFSGVSVNGITAVSRSLSGAPYLSSATYTISGSVLGLFNPLYYAGTGIATITSPDTLVSESGGITTVSTLGGTIVTPNAVYDSTGVTVRSTGTVPYETDIVKVYTTSSFAPGTSDENISQTGLGTTSFSLNINGLNKAGTTTTNTSTVSYHTAGTFGQPSASGSLAYYGRAQGEDTATNGQVSSNSEPFLGENYRIQLTDGILAFTGTTWDTTFGLYNLGAKDLQVKPGYLVKPGGTYGYWLTNPSAASDYKYYVRKVTTNAGVKGSMTLNMGATLVNWDATTSNSVSCLVLFESTKSGLFTPPKFFDPSNVLTNLGTITANTDGTNPFGSDIQVSRCNGTTVSSTTYNIILQSGDGMLLNATYTNIYVIVRYKGDPTPITSITTTFSS